MDVDRRIDVYITLSDVNIDLSSSGSASEEGTAAFAIAAESECITNITLTGINTLKSGYGRAGLENNEEAIIIQGNETLNATGGLKDAGIGGKANLAGKNVTISSGTVNTTGQNGGAGIGGGSGGAGDSITISGGTVSANGGIEAAGIGNGFNNGSIGNIALTGGTTEVKGRLIIDSTYHGPFGDATVSFFNNNQSDNKWYDWGNSKKHKVNPVITYVSNITSYNDMTDHTNEVQVLFQPTIYKTQQEAPDVSVDGASISGLQKGDIATNTETGNITTITDLNQVFRLWRV